MKQIKPPTLLDAVPPHYVDALIKKYDPPRKPNGELYPTVLEYISVESNEIEKPEFKKCFKSLPAGLEYYGFLIILRLHMAKSHGFGFCTSSEEYEIILYGISLYYGYSEERVAEMLEVLKQHGLLIEIDDKSGNTYLTTYQQLYNLEVLLHNRYQNRYRQWKKKQTAKEKDKQNSINRVDISPADTIPMSGTTNDDSPNEITEGVVDAADISTSWVSGEFFEDDSAESNEENLFFT